MTRRLPGAMVISLDFELLWGLRDRPGAAETFGDNLRGAREVVPKLLELFQEFDVAATWATVGFLFARSGDEIARFRPKLRPSYRDPMLCPYGDVVGDSEAEDPLHLAPTLIERIARMPRQEVATHTFSHYYCGEAGQTPETFRADLEAAQAIANVRNLELRSIVFPRNQLGPSYLRVLPDVGIRCFRGNPPGGAWGFSDASGSRRPWRRMTRLLDGYWGPSHGTVPWSEVLRPDGLADVRATCFLPPVRPRLRRLEGLRLRRMRLRIRRAARDGALVHLWWHPHNFGRRHAENLGFLGAVLEEFASCRRRYGMVSLSMVEAGDTARDAYGDSLPARPTWTR